MVSNSLPLKCERFNGVITANISYWGNQYESVYEYSEYNIITVL